MCGIAGVLYRDPTRSPDPAVLRQMGAAIAHRGPDGEGFYQSGPAGLVHRRLAIIDPEGGQQPIASEDESVCVVFNGEIYNFRELRADLERRGHTFRTRSDTEVLVHLYEEQGADMCRALRGMFAFAIWDARRRQLFLARDHLGQKPLYVYRDAEQIVFASELKAILAHPGVDRRVSPVAIEDYLAWGFLPGERSVFASASRLQAAHHLTLSPQAWDARPVRYWSLNFAVDSTLSDDDWIDRIDAAVRESVRAHLVSDVPVGAFLSGGLDSSVIVACAAEHVAAPLQTFSIGFREQEFSELPLAETVAEQFGCSHTTQIVTPDAARDLDDLVFYYDEPFADPSAIATMAVSRMASEYVKVVLSGDGGDELFAGYTRHAHDLREAALRSWLPEWFRSRLLRPLSVAWPQLDWLPRPLRVKTTLENLSRNPAAAYANTLAQCRTALRNSLLRRERFPRGEHDADAVMVRAFSGGGPDVLNGMLATDTAVLLPDDFLVKVDRASMGFGLEVRPPFVDRTLMELAATMPSRLKINGGVQKWILKRIFASRLPEQHTRHPKQGFEVPVDAWLRGPLRDQVEQVVLNPLAPLAEFIDTARVRRLYQAHCNATARYGNLLWSLLVLGRWLGRWTQPTTAPRMSASDSRPLPAGVSTSLSQEVPG